MKPSLALRPLFVFAALFIACSDERTERVDHSSSAIAVPVTEEARASCVYQTRIDPPGARKYNLKSHTCPEGFVCPAGGANAAVGCSEVRDGDYAETKCTCVEAPAACNIPASWMSAVNRPTPLSSRGSSCLRTLFPTQVMTDASRNLR